MVGIAGADGAHPGANAVQEVPSARHRLSHRILHSGLGELEHRPVVRAAQAHRAQPAAPAATSPPAWDNTLPSDLLIFSPPIVTQPLCSQRANPSPAARLWAISALGDVRATTQPPTAMDIEFARGEPRAFRCQPDARGPTASATTVHLPFFHKVKSLVPLPVQPPFALMTSSILHRITGQLWVAQNVGNVTAAGATCVRAGLDQALDHLTIWVMLVARLRRGRRQDVQSVRNAVKARRCG